MRLPAVILAISGVMGILVLPGLFHIVSEYEQAVVTEMGKPVACVTEPGIYLKVPFAQKVRLFEKRILRWSSGPIEACTSDGNAVSMVLTAGWKIKDPVLFLETVQTYDRAYAGLDGIIEAVAKARIPACPLAGLVRSSNLTDTGRADPEVADPDREGPTGSPVIEGGREEIEALMLADAAKEVLGLGIELVDLRMKQLNYVETLRHKVYERMIAEQKRQAARLRSEGEGQKALISGRMEKELQIIRSEAFKAEEEIRGRADAEAARIHGRAYGKDPELYSFLKTLESCKEAPLDNTTLILGTDTDYFRYLKGTGK